MLILRKVIRDSSWQLVQKREPDTEIELRILGKQVDLLYDNQAFAILL